LEIWGVLFVGVVKFFRWQVWKMEIGRISVCTTQWRKFVNSWSSSSYQQRS